MCVLSEYVCINTVPNQNRMLIDALYYDCQYCNADRIVLNVTQMQSHYESIKINIVNS